MKIHSLSRKEVLEDLVASEDGLSRTEVLRRTAEFGHNEIESAKKKPLILRFAAQFTHFLALLLWVAALLSFGAEYVHPGEGMLSLGVAIVCVILINAIFTFVQEYRAERALAEMKKLLPFQVQVVRSGVQEEVPAHEVVPGDIILLAEGDRVPADLRMLEVEGIRLDNSPLTGESEPVPGSAEPFHGDIMSSPNIAFAGTNVVAGSGKGVAFATGMKTEFGRIAQLTGSVTSGLSPLQKEMVRITRVVTLIAGATGLFFFAVGLAIGRTFWETFLFAIGILLANVPEGLLPTVTLALAIGSQRLAKKKVLVKSLTAVETLGSVTVICTDKTGTLTQNLMSVRKVLQWNSASERAEGKIFSPLEIGALCNSVREVAGKLKGDPTEVALYEAGVKSGVPQHERIREMPFDSDLKRMSVISAVGDTHYLLLKGAPERLVELCSCGMTEDGMSPMDDHLKKRILAASGELMDRGLRVLAFGFRKLVAHDSARPRGEIECALTFSGLIGLEDPPRPEVPDAIRKCRDAGIRIIMVTGDSSRTALAIAREIGLVTGEPAIVEGPEFVCLTDRQLRDVLGNKEVIFSRMTPRHKLRVVNILKEEGERVAVTGDGVNDAPALKRADIGIAMGLSGTDVAKESADMVLMDDNFATIISAVEEGRAIFENIRKFITYIFAHLTEEAIPYILFVLFRTPLPLTVMQILAIDLGTETLPALALGMEPPEAGIMKQPPRSPDKRLINATVLVRGYLFLGLLSTVGVLFGYFFVLYGGGWHFGVELPSGSVLAREAATATFLGIVLMQIGNAYACRTQTESVFVKGLLSNRLLLWGIAVELLLTAGIIYTEFGNRVFATEPLAVEVWLYFVPFILVVFFAEELRKKIMHSRTGT